ncbi:MAG: carotenoid biosynthesis protein [Anaerolineales bacterium]
MSRRIMIILLLLYALLTLYSVCSIALGGHPSPWLIPINTLAGFGFALLHARQREGWSRALRLLGSVFVVSLLFESAGVATGWIYGPYHYTHQLGPLFLGLVPYLIPLAWFMTSYPAFVIADRLLPAEWNRLGRLLAVAAISGLVMTAWDLVMDPFMVAAGYWVWETRGPYFGIPLQNFWGWWLTVFTSIALYLLISGKASRPTSPRFDQLALASYLVTLLGAVGISLLTHAGGPALVGFFAMAPWLVSGWLRTARE